MELWDENPRPRYKDGEEANSLFITQVFEKYNIQHGEFPIPNNKKKLQLKTGIKGNILDIPETK